MHPDFSAGQQQSFRASHFPGCNSLYNRLALFSRRIERAGNL